MAENLRILAVDDTADIRELYTLLLADHEVRTAPDGPTALERLDSQTDLVLLDRDMPGPSGLEVAEEIASQDIDCHVAMVSSMAPEFDIVSMPIDQYARKPVDTEMLTSIVDQCITQREYRDVLQEFFSLSSQLAAIEANHSASDLADSPEYEQLQTKVERKRAEVDAALTTDDTDWDVAFKSAPGFASRPSDV